MEPASCMWQHLTSIMDSCSSEIIQRCMFPLWHMATDTLAANMNLNCERLAWYVTCKKHEYTMHFSIPCQQHTLPRWEPSNLYIIIMVQLILSRHVHLHAHDAWNLQQECNNMQITWVYEAGDTEINHDMWSAQLQAIHSVLLCENLPALWAHSKDTVISVLGFTDSALRFCV